MAMLTWTPHAWEEYLYWQQTDKKILQRINLLIKDIEREAFDGIGKPEPLKYDLAAYWSRRINQAHRLIYAFENNVITIIQCRYHYGQ